MLFNFYYKNISNAVNSSQVEGADNGTVAIEAV